MTMDPKKAGNVVGAVVFWCVMMIPVWALIYVGVRAVFG